MKFLIFLISILYAMSTEHSYIYEVEVEGITKMQQENFQPYISNFAGFLNEIDYRNNKAIFEYKNFNCGRKKKRYTPTITTINKKCPTITADKYGNRLDGKVPKDIKDLFHWKLINIRTKCNIGEVDLGDLNTYIQSLLIHTAKNKMPRRLCCKNK
jgi:hypothetical protein